MRALEFGERANRRREEPGENRFFRGVVKARAGPFKDANRSLQPAVLYVQPDDRTFVIPGLFGCMRCLGGLFEFSSGRLDSELEIVRD